MAPVPWTGLYKPPVQSGNAFAARATAPTARIAGARRPARGERRSDQSFAAPIAIRTANDRFTMAITLYVVRSPAAPGAWAKAQSRSRPKGLGLPTGKIPTAITIEAMAARTK